MFPIHIKGRIELPDTTPEQAAVIADRIVAALVAVRASGVECRANRITFRGGIFRMVFNWNVLAAVSHGVVDVQSGSKPMVDYTFYCWEMLAFVMLPILFVVLHTSINESPLVRFGIPVFIFLWLFGVNYFVARFRLPAFLRDAINACEVGWAK
ncbi:MAG: hypothetical protein JWR07_1688 [Nevskia sp.]|nr:hypothetical protein [Nevskia sp.]